jgi:hypothetical protein
MTSEAIAPEVEDVQDAGAHLVDVLARKRPTVLERDGREVGVVFPLHSVFLSFAHEHDDEHLWLSLIAHALKSDPSLGQLLKAKFGTGEPADAIRQLLAENEDMKRRLALRVEAEIARNDPDDRAEIRQIMREFDEIDAG